MSAIDDLTYRVIKDGYGVQYPSRATIKYLNAVIRDNELLEQTEIDLVQSASTSIGLSDVLSNSNNANNNRIVNLADPVFSGDAANKRYVDSKGLSDIISVNNSANNLQIINVATPTNLTDVATKGYVDSLLEVVTTNSGTLNSTSTYQQMVSIPVTSAVSTADIYYVRIFNSLTKRVCNLTYSIYNNAGTYQYQFEGSVNDLITDGYISIAGFQIKSKISESNLIIYGLGSSSTTIDYKISWNKNITYKPNDIGITLDGTITAGTSYQTLVSYGPSLATGEKATLYLRLFTSKKNKFSTITYSLFNDAGTLKIVNIDSASDNSSSDTTYLSNLQYFKTTVSGSNLLFQVLQESGLTYNFRLNYILWKL